MKEHVLKRICLAAAVVGLVGAAGGAPQTTPPQTPTTPTVPSVPQAPTVPQAPVVPRVPVVPNAPLVPQAPTLPQAATVPQAPIAAQAAPGPVVVPANRGGIINSNAINTNRFAPTNRVPTNAVPKTQPYAPIGGAFTSGSGRSNGTVNGAVYPGYPPGRSSSSNEAGGIRASTNSFKTGINTNAGGGQLR